MAQMIIIPVLVFLSAIGLGGAVVIAMGDRRKLVQARKRMAHGSVDSGAFNGSSTNGLEGFRKIGDAVSKGKTSKGLKQTLASAGLTAPSAASIFIGVKLVLIALAVMWGVGGGILLELKPLAIAALGVTAATLAMIAPNLLVSLLRKRRRLDVQHHLPDAIDLLEICVSCGMGLDTAWNAVSDEIRPVSTVLADEMALSNLEIQLGSTRASALRNMAERTSVDDLASLVSLLVQSDRFGTSIAEALRTFAESLRDIRTQRASENAEKMAVKLLFPMVLFIFPVMLIIMVGPAGIRLAEVIATS